MSDSQSSRTCFPVGPYRLDMPCAEVRGLSEASVEEYRVLGRRFDGERIFHANSAEFLGVKWEVLLAAVNERVYKVAPSFETFNDQVADRVAKGVFNYCEGHLGKSKTIEPGVFAWDANDGNVVLQRARTESARYVINLFLTSSSIRSFQVAAERSGAPKVFCSSCGKQIESDARFCSHCGGEQVASNAEDAQDMESAQRSRPTSADNPSATLAVQVDLLQRCAVFIEIWNERESIDFSKVLWHRETMVMLAQIPETLDLLSEAGKAWRKKTRDKNLIPACALVLALEILNADFLGWGSRHPLAKAQAQTLLAQHSPQDRQRMMQIFQVSKFQEGFDNN